MNAAGAVGFSVIVGPVCWPARYIISVETLLFHLARRQSLASVRLVELPGGRRRTIGRQKERSSLIPLATPTLLYPARSRPASHLRGFSHIGICRRIFCSPLSFSFTQSGLCVVRVRCAREREMRMFFFLFSSPSLSRRTRERKRDSSHQGRERILCKS